jgi:ABC-type dipeptide/oligopeptide/nickel transport system permease subunit
MTLTSIGRSLPSRLDADAPLATAGLGRRLLAHRGFLVGAILAVLLLALTFIGPLLTHDPNATDYAHQLLSPGSAHWLGTDGAGRDEFARTVAGARTSLGAALLVFVISTGVGVLVGVVAGLAGGPVDLVLSRIIDLLLGLPSLVLALAVVGALGPGFSHLVLAMAITGWAGLAKLSRAYTLGAPNRPDVLAARMAGIPMYRIAVGHVLPGVISQALIAATLLLGDTILGLAGLSFLGLGVQPPTAEWGAMLNEARADLTIAPWLLIGPGVGIIAAVTAATLISDALRDSSDPGRLS